MPGERQTCGLQELVAGHAPAGFDAPQGHLHHVFTASRAVAFDDVSQLVLDASEPQRCHPCPQHLAVEGVGQAHGGAPSGHHQRDQPSGLQLLQGGQTVATFEVGEAEALAHGEQFEHREPGFVDAGEVLVDQLVERRGGRQVAHQAPRAAVAHEGAPFGGAANQLGEHLQVAARQPRQLVERGGRHRMVEGAVQQHPELVGPERVEVEAHEVTVSLETGESRRRCPPDTVSADGADEECRARHHERHQHGDGRVVEQVEVVDEQHEAVVAGHPAQLGASAVEQSGPLVVADPEPADQRRRQEVSKRAERDRRHRLVSDGAGRRTACTLGAAQRLLGQARLAHAGRAVDHHAARRAGAVVAVDRIQLGRAAGERPAGVHHRRLTHATPTRLICREVTARGAAESTMFRVYVVGQTVPNAVITKIAADSRRESTRPRWCGRRDGLIRTISTPAFAGRRACRDNWRRRWESNPCTGLCRLAADQRVMPAQTA